MYSIIPFHKSSHYILNQIHKIETKSFASPWNMEHLKNEIKNTHSYSFVLLKNRCIIGYIISTKIDEIVQINKLCIKEEFRSNKLGYRLLNTFIAESAKCNANRIYLEVNENNVNAVALYKKVGFKLLRIRKNIFKNLENGYEMMLHIKNYTESPFTFSIVQLP